LYSLEFYLAITGLLLSFFFAGSEIAFTSFNKLRLDVWFKQRVPFAGNAARFVQKPEEFFSTILVGNNLANILCTTFATYILIAFYDETITWLIITGAVLFFGEILPKTLFRPLADKIILKILLLVRLFYFLSKPFITFINYFVERFLRLLRVKHTAVMTYFSREEMKLLLHEGYGFLRPESEQKYLRNILEFSESRVREAMTPRAEMIAASQKVKMSEILQLMADHRLSRIPIYDTTLDNIIGIV
jgi:putative hemolysin